MGVKAGSLRGMPRAGLNACKLMLAGRIESRQLARHAARRLERLQA